jgi:hypothetical protein
VATVLAITVTLLLGSTPAGADEAVSQWRFSGIERVVAIGDVHGAYPALVALLQETGLISAEGSWAGGSSHLVMLGDIVDRGPASRAALTLVMRLQSEAQRAGGQVHVVLGNHEVMNLVGDLRYASPNEFAAYAADEVTHAARMMLEDKVGSLPVTEGGRLVGIITETDLLRELCRADAACSPEVTDVVVSYP